VIPGLGELRGYRRAWLAGDLLAGVTVAAYLVPQVMAYATIAGLPPVTGLWAAVPALIAYVLFGSSKSLSMGPEATTALMTWWLSSRWPPEIRPGTPNSRARWPCSSG
jgi:sulfate permease, SulP family